METLDGPTEVILVDDGSIDSSFHVISQLAQDDPRFSGIRLSRNFGHQPALTAGMLAARGAAIITMDADLQHPPETIPEMAELWRSGFDVVYGIMESRLPQSLPKRTLSHFFYRLIKKTSTVDMIQGAGDFRLASRRVVEVIRLMPERNPYLRGMFSWTGFRHTVVHYPCGDRVGGRTKYTLPRMLTLAADGIVGFSSLPLRLFLLIGFSTSLISILFGVTALIVKLSGTYNVPGWATLVVITSFLGGVQLFVLGVVGEYIGRIYDEVKGRPTFVVADEVGRDVDVSQSVPLTRQPVRNPKTFS